MRVIGAHRNEPEKQTILFPTRPTTGREEYGLLKTAVLQGSFHVKSTQKMDDPSGFSSNLVRPMHIQSNLATPNFYPIREGQLKVLILAKF